MRRADRRISSGEESQSQSDETPFTTPTRNEDNFDSKSSASGRSENNSIITRTGTRIESILTSQLSIGDRSVPETYLPAIFAVFLLITAAGSFLVYGAQTAPETTTETRMAGT